ASQYKCLYDVHHATQGYQGEMTLGLLLRGPDCISGNSETFSWPLGRELKSVGDASHSPFGIPLPSSMCINGCRASGPFSAGDDSLYAVPDPENSEYEIIYANIDAVLDG